MKEIKIRNGGRKEKKKDDGNVILSAVIYKYQYTVLRIFLKKRKKENETT